MEEEVEGEEDEDVGLSGDLDLRVRPVDDDEDGVLVETDSFSSSDNAEERDAEDEGDLAGVVAEDADADNFDPIDDRRRDVDAESG